MSELNVSISMYSVDPECICPMYIDNKEIDGYAKADFSNMITDMISRIKDTFHLDYLGSERKNQTNLTLKFSNNVSIHVFVEDQPGIVKENDEVRSMLKDTGRKWYVSNIQVEDDAVEDFWQVSFAVVKQLQNRYAE